MTENLRFRNRARTPAAMVWICLNIAAAVCFQSHTFASDLDADPAQLLAGTAMVEITPPRNYPMAGYFHERLNEGFLDPLNAKALVFSQGKVKVALVICDLIAIPQDLADTARERIAKRTGIPVARVAIAATHCHTGPELRPGLNNPARIEAYRAELIDNLVKAVVAADKTLQPVDLARGGAQVRGVAFNRRFHMKDGSVRFNPGVRNPDIVKVAGPIDPEAGLVLIRPQGKAGKDQAQPLALITVFAMHLDTVGGMRYSADYPYHYANALRTELKGESAKNAPDMSLFFAGTCGDINHIDVTSDKRAKTEAIGKALADAVVPALETLKPIAKPRLAAATASIIAPLQSVTPEALAKARATLKRASDPNAKPPVPFLEHVEAWKYVDLADNYPPSGQTHLEVQAIRISDDLAVVTLPGEVFVELGLEIKRRSPFAQTLVAELTNACPAYVPTRKAFGEGSYEIVNSRVQPGVGEDLVNTAVKLLKQLHDDAPANSASVKKP